MHGKRLVELVCHHVLEFDANRAPKKHETELWCRRCGTVREIGQSTDQWTVTCQECPYARSFGTARITAETAAARHMIKKHHHLVMMFGYDLATRKDVMPNKNQQSLFGEAPF